MIQFLKEKQWDVISFVDNPAINYSDSEMLEAATSLGRTFLFHSKGFSKSKMPMLEMIPFGILHIAIDPPVVEKVLPILHSFLQLWKEQSFDHRYVLLGNESYRVIERHKDETYYYF